MRIKNDKVRCVVREARRREITYAARVDNGGKMKGRRNVRKKRNERKATMDDKKCPKSAWEPWYQQITNMSFQAGSPHFEYLENRYAPRKVAESRSYTRRIVMVP
jgi:hypothetical protein